MCCVAGTTQRTIKDANVTTASFGVQDPHITPPFSSSTLPTPTYSQTAPPYNPQQQHQQHQQPQQQRSYADVTSNRAQLAEEPTTTLKTFLDEFKGLFAQLIHQNSTILDMLSTLLNK